MVRSAKTGAALAGADEEQVEERGEAGDGSGEPCHIAGVKEDGLAGCPQEENQGDAQHDERADGGSERQINEKLPFAEVCDGQHDGEREEPARQAGNQHEEAEDESFKTDGAQGLVGTVLERGNE